jgi:hypothetical protein
MIGCDEKSTPMTGPADARAGDRLPPVARPANKGAGEGGFLAPGPPQWLGRPGSSPLKPSFVARVADGLAAIALAGCSVLQWAVAHPNGGPVPWC